MKKHLFPRILAITLIVVLFFVGVILGYCSVYYHATDKTGALSNTATVTVSKIKEGYFFDGPGTSDAFVFYPGGKVQDIAYADLMKAIAEKGMDCFLLHMPLNLAVFKANAALPVVEKYDYDRWYIGGHSLGGVMSCSFVASRPDLFDGIILFASYSSKDISNLDIPVLLMYGSNDKVLNDGAVEKSRGLMPKVYTEVCIEGANHAQFGDYGTQKGDGLAGISHLQQISKAADLIDDFLR